MAVRLAASTMPHPLDSALLLLVNRPGDDPVLNGEYGALFVSGFQGDESQPANGSAPLPPLRSLKSSACAKQ